MVQKLWRCLKNVVDYLGCSGIYIWFSLLFYDVCMVFLIKLKEIPITIFSAVFPKIRQSHLACQIPGNFKTILLIIYNLTNPTNQLIH